MRVRLSAGVALAIIGAAGCTDAADTETPVPSTAEARFGCPGVPLRGAELMSGNEELSAGDDSGRWGDDGGEFYCRLVDSDDEDDTAVIVREMPLSHAFSGSAESVVETMRSNTGAQRIESDQPGEGYVWPSGERSSGGTVVNAWWVCDDRFLQVDLYTRDFEGRDFLEDVSRYVSSMLPWACAGDDVPDDA